MARASRVEVLSVVGPSVRAWPSSVSRDVPCAAGSTSRRASTSGSGVATPAAGSVMRLAFCLDGYTEQVAAAVTQPSAQVLRVEVQGEADPHRVADQVARVLSVDVDGTGYDELGARDPVVGAAQAQASGSASAALLLRVRGAALVGPVGAPAAAPDGRGPRAARPGARADVHGRRRRASRPSRCPSSCSAVPAVRRDPRDQAAPHARDRPGRPRRGARHGDAARPGPGRDPRASCRRSRGSGRSTPSWSWSGRSVTPTFFRSTSRWCAARSRRPSARHEPLDPDRLAQVAEAWRPWRTWVGVALRATATGRR